MPWLPKTSSASRLTRTISNRVLRNTLPFIFHVHKRQIVLTTGSTTNRTIFMTWNRGRISSSSSRGGWKAAWNRGKARWNRRRCARSSSGQHRPKILPTPVIYSGNCAPTSATAGERQSRFLKMQEPTESSTNNAPPRLLLHPSNMMHAHICLIPHFSRALRQCSQSLGFEKGEPSGGL